MNGWQKLNLLQPDVTARATDYVAEDKRSVDEMTRRGFTYETSDGVYYDTSKFPGYADFARLNLAGLQAGARVEFSKEKRNAADFAVWKFIKPGEKHEMRWDYLDRPGYPGWHLECSTIIDTELGEPIDIHTGGVDHIPVHHTNEIAQTYALSGHGQEFSHFWLHCSHITIDNVKISKSLGNVYLLSDLAEKGFLPLDYKMWVLSGHYQGTRNFTFESLEGAKARRLAWRNRIALCYQKEIPENPEAVAKIMEALNDNLNSAEAFAVIDNSELSLADWQKIEELFGLGLITETPDLTPEDYDLIHEREKARAEKNFERSDEIRNELSTRGITLNDGPGGTVWGYAH